MAVRYYMYLLRYMYRYYWYDYGRILYSSTVLPVHFIAEQYYRYRMTVLPVQFIAERIRLSEWWSHQSLVQ